MIDDEPEVLADTHDVRRHPHFTAPGADPDRAVAVVDHRRGPVDQVPLAGAVEVEAAARRVQLEPAVERGQQAVARARRDPRRGFPVARAGVLGPGMQMEADQPLVQRHDPGHVGGVHAVRAQEGGENRGLFVDRLKHAPDALARQRLGGRRGQLLRNVRHESVRALVILRRGAGRGGQGEARLAAHLGRLVRDPLAEGHHRAQVMVPGPFGQLGGDRTAAGRGQRLPDREGGPAAEHRDEDQDDPDRTQAEEPADPARPAPAPASPAVARPVARPGRVAAAGESGAPIRLVLVRPVARPGGVARLGSVAWPRSVRLRAVGTGFVPRGLVPVFVPRGLVPV